MNTHCKATSISKLQSITSVHNLGFNKCLQFSINCNIANKNWFHSLQNKVSLFDKLRTDLMIFLIGILGILSLHFKVFGHFYLYLVTTTWLEQVLSVLWLVLDVHGVLSLLPFTCLLPFTSLLLTILFVLIIFLIFPIIIFITCKIIPNLYL